MALSAEEWAVAAHDWAEWSAKVPEPIPPSGAWDAAWEHCAEHMTHLAGNQYLMGMVDGRADGWEQAANWLLDRAANTWRAGSDEFAGVLRKLSDEALAKSKEARARRKELADAEQ